MQNDPRDIVAVFDEVAEFIEAITTGHPKVPRPVVDHLDRRFHGSEEAQCLCATPRDLEVVAGLHPSCSISLCDECPDRQRSETQVIGARFRDLIANMPHDVLWFTT